MISIQTNGFRALKVALIGFLMLACLGSACLSLHGEQRDIIDARQMLNSQENIANCLRVSLQKGNIGLARSIISVYDSQYQNLFLGIFQNQLKRLKLMQQQIVLTESTCQPVTKWGQNESHIFLSMKMSHRWDSPPCLNTKTQNYQLNNNTFEYTNVCVVSHSKITFKFGIQFYDDVISEDIIVHKDGVGIYSTIIQKYVAKVWPFLSREEKNYQIWGQISQRHNSVHHEYQNLVDGIVRARKSKPVIFEQSKVENNQSTTQTAKNEQIKQQIPSPANQVENQIENSIEDNKKNENGIAPQQQTTTNEK